MKEILPDYRTDTIKRISKEAEPFEDIDQALIDRFLERCSRAKVVLLGESTHGTSEFYRMRAKISQELIRQCGFNFIAIEAGWGDVEAIDQSVRHLPRGPLNKNVFGRFAAWMWKNREFCNFIDWVKSYNLAIPAKNRIGLYGLDIYGMDVSIEVILNYLERHSPNHAQAILELYNGLIPYKENPVQYGNGVHQKTTPSLAEKASEALRHISTEPIGEREAYFHLIRNMRLIEAAEEYFRTVYENGVKAWNVRDRYMFETLEAVLAFKGADTKAIIWAHNSHTGSAAGSYMAENGYLNIGQLCAEKYGERAYRVGLGFYTGTVMAAPYWGGPHNAIETGPSPADSYEDLFFESGLPAFFLPLRQRPLHAVRQALLTPRIQRGIGLSFNPQDQKTNLYSARLPEQFDEFIWFKQTQALSPLAESDYFPTHSGLK